MVKKYEIALRCGGPLFKPAIFCCTHFWEIKECTVKYPEADFKNGFLVRQVVKNRTFSVLEKFTVILKDFGTKL